MAGHKEESTAMEEATQDLQLQAMRRDLCGLQQSNSLSAVEMLRWAGEGGREVEGGYRCSGGKGNVCGGT